MEEPKEYLKYIDISVAKPVEPGKYIVKTKSKFSTQKLETRFNGNTFDVNNQVVIGWYKIVEI
jgi:hypothetical protein